MSHSTVQFNRIPTSPCSRRNIRPEGSGGPQPYRLTCFLLDLQNLLDISGLQPPLAIKNQSWATGYIRLMNDYDGKGESMVIHFPLRPFHRKLQIAHCVCCHSTHAVVQFEPTNVAPSSNYTTQNMRQNIRWATHNTTCTTKPNSEKHRLSPESPLQSRVCKFADNALTTHTR